nr:MAG TPA: hypothetical protein [Caudoviricetes sp.]
MQVLSKSTLQHKPHLQVGLFAFMVLTHVLELLERLN